MHFKSKFDNLYKGSTIMCAAVIFVAITTSPQTTWAFKVLEAVTSKAKCVGLLTKEGELNSPTNRYLRFLRYVAVNKNAMTVMQLKRLSDKNAAVNFVADGQASLRGVEAHTFSEALEQVLELSPKIDITLVKKEIEKIIEAKKLTEISANVAHEETAALFLPTVLSEDFFPPEVAESRILKVFSSKNRGGFMSVWLRGEIGTGLQTGTYVYDFQQNEFKFMHPENSGNNSFFETADGKLYFITTRGNPHVQSSTQKIEVYDVASGQVVNSYPYSEFADASGSLNDENANRVVAKVFPLLSSGGNFELLSVWQNREGPGGRLTNAETLNSRPLDIYNAELEYFDSYSKNTVLAYGWSKPQTLDDSNEKSNIDLIVQDLKSGDILFKKAFEYKKVLTQKPWLYLNQKNDGQDYLSVFTEDHLTVFGIEKGSTRNFDTKMLARKIKPFLYKGKLTVIGEASNGAFPIIDVESGAVRSLPYTAERFPWDINSNCQVVTFENGSPRLLMTNLMNDTLYSLNLDDGIAEQLKFKANIWGPPLSPVELKDGTQLIFVYYLVGPKLRASLVQLYGSHRR